MADAGKVKAGAFRWLLLALAFLNVAPLFLTEVLPFTDVPEHLAVMASLTQWHDASFRIAEHYRPALTSPYWLYHASGALLAFALGPDLANRLLLALAGVALPFALAALLRALRRDERLALFALPLFWNRALVVGFLPFVASLPLVLFVLAAFVRQLEGPRPRRALALAGAAVPLYYVHASALLVVAVVGAALALAAEVERGTAVRELPARLLGALSWLVPAGAVAALVAARGRITLRGESLSEQGEVGRMSAGRTVRAFSLWAHDTFRGHGDEACAVVFWLAFIVLLLATVRHERHARTSRVLMAPLLSLALLYFVVPFRVGAAAMLNVRMAPLLALFALLPLTVPPTRWAKLALTLAGVAAVGTPLYAASRLLALEDEVQGAVALFAKVPRGARLVSLPFRQRSEVAHFPPFIHFGAYHRVRNGGVAAFSFSELHHWPLHFRPEAAPPAKREPFWSLRPCAFRNAVDGPYYDAALVRGDVDPFRDEPPGPAWRRVASVRDFTLYEKVPGVTWRAWETPDEGPCAARRGPAPVLEVDGE